MKVIDRFKKQTIVCDKDKLLQTKDELEKDSRKICMFGIDYEDNGIIVCSRLCPY